MPRAKKTEEKKNEVAVVKKNEMVVAGAVEVDDIDFGMLDLGTKLKINKKGNFVGEEVEGIDLGDELTGIIIKTVFEFSMWRDEKIEGKLDEDVNKLILVANRPNEAEAMFDQLDDELELTEKGYSKRNIKGKAILTLQTEDGTLYVVRTNATGLIQFQKYASAVINGVYGNTKYETSTARGTVMKGRLNKVVTKLYTDEIKRGKYDVMTILFAFEGNVE